MSAHTPGPWTKTNTHMYSQYIHAPGHRQMYFLGGSSDIPDDEHEANACLIAAAPELLESLEISMDYLGHPDCEWAKKAREAIAKAKGENHE